MNAGEKIMEKRLLTVIALIAILLQPGFAQQPSAQPADPVVKGAMVKAADQIKLPAKEPGVLVQLNVKKGSQVRAGQILGKIDDSEPQMKKMAPKQEYAGADKR